MRASCEIYTIPRWCVRVVPGSTPGRRTTGPPTPPTSRRINNSCTRALDALTNSQLHPKCIRFAGDVRRDAGMGKGLRTEPARPPARVFLRVPRCSCADIHICAHADLHAARLVFRAGSFAKDRRKGDRGKIYTIYVVFSSFFLALWPNLLCCCR